MPTDKKTCFIIMPITTPETLLDRYDNDEDHFIHVLEHLHMPAVEAAGYEPIPPNAQGSDLIHAEIIKNLESADMVLCDISTLNPNVFFELGIRTSLNKPVCYVKDEHTKKIPFDTGILNHKEYHSTIRPWDLKVDLPMIMEHLKVSYERSKDENSLWRHFGIRAGAKPYERATGTEGKIDDLLFQMQALHERIGNIERGTDQGNNDIPHIEIIHQAENMFPDGAKLITAGYAPNTKDKQILYSGVIPNDVKERIRRRIYAKYGINLKLIQEKDYDKAIDIIQRTGKNNKLA